MVEQPTYLRPRSNLGQRSLRFLLNDAQRLTREGRHAQAVKTYESIYKSLRRYVKRYFKKNPAQLVGGSIDNHPDLLEIRHHIATVIIDEGRYDEAEAMLAELHEKFQVVCGNTSPDTLRVAVSMATVHSLRGEYDLAAEEFQETLRLTEEHVGRGSLASADLCRALATTYRLRGQYRESSAMWSRARRIYDRHELSVEDIRVVGLYNEVREFLKTVRPPRLRKSAAEGGEASESI